MCLFGTDPGRARVGSVGTVPSTKEGNAMNEPRKLFSTTHVAKALGVSPPSLHSYMHQRDAGTDPRFAQVPVPNYVIVGQDGSHTPLWSVAEVAWWVSWYAGYKEQRDPRGGRTNSEKSAADD